MKTSRLFGNKKTGSSNTMFIQGSHSTTKAENKPLVNMPIPPVNNDTTTVAKFRLLRFFVKQSIWWSKLGGGQK